MLISTDKKQHRVELHQLHQTMEDFSHVVTMVGCTRSKY